MPAPYPAQQRAAREQLKALFAHRPTVCIVHYSSESFDDRENGKSPRVTSIAVRRLDSGQTESFSIHAVAEERRVDLAAIDKHYDSLEKEMLERFYAYAARHSDVSYLHWNMRDSNYGFSALSHRLHVLGGTSVDVPEHRRYDLARMLQEIYGTEYIEHPRLPSLAKKNGISMSRFLAGKDEADAFARGQYVAIHQSTLRKVDMIADIAERTYYGTLKTNSGWWTMNGGSLRGAINWIASNAIITLVFTLIGIAIGAVGAWAGLAALHRGP